MNEDRSVRYHRLKRRLTVLSLLWSAGLLLVLALSGASRRLAEGVAAVSATPAATLALFVLALALIHEPVSAALDFYGGYVLEHRYGLSRETIAAWVVDHVK